MSLTIRGELARAQNALKRVDLQTAVVLLFAALSVILQMKLGDRGLFRREIAPILGIEQPGLASWIWWFGMQGFLGFILPVYILRFGFRVPVRVMGLGRGDHKFALRVAAIYLPVVLIGTWFLSDSASFQENYPHFVPATQDWNVFLIYEAFFLFYWMGWEYLWRGFVLFGTARTFGIMAIFVQAVPFAILHFDKPLPEALLSIVGGVLLGALVWRARSFWIAVPIHAAQMLIIDLWCTFRIRTGVSGKGPAALLEMFRALGE